MVKCCEIMIGLSEEYPLCCKDCQDMFDDVCHHVLVMQDAADKLGVPLEELIEFFHKGKHKLEEIKEKEEELKNNGEHC